MSVDISSEAVEVVAKEIAALGSREAQTMPTGWEDAYWLYDKTAATLRAQAERIGEIEADNAILRTEKHADADAITAMDKDAAMDRLVAEGQRCEATVTPQEAAKVEAVKSLKKITATRYGLQNIIEDYGHDTNAYNYHAMKYWQGVANAHQANARAALRAISEDSQ